MIDNETIIAQATPPGRGSIGVLRISGPKARDVAEAVLGKLPKPRYAEYLLFKDANDSPLDKGIALWFPRPNSFTGEDVLELHGHGGPVVLDLLLRYISSLPGVRIASPGEFSERAFLNDKLDLTQAEAISDLINASSEQAVRSALSSFQGAFSIRVKNLIEKILHLRTYVEATIDFPDEEEIGFSLHNKISLHLDEIIDYLNVIYTQAQQGSFLREETRVVIAGFPNVGKSSLLNILTGQESAIITNIAGTTRDVLHEHIYIDGLPIHIIDTAGLRNAKEDEIERIGIARAWQEIKKANHILFMVDSTIVSEMNLEKIWPDYASISHLPNDQSITLICNKIDITGEKPGIKVINGHSVIFLSARTGVGVDILRNFLKEKISFNSDIEVIFLARQRHFKALTETMNHLIQGKSYLISGNSWTNSDLFAEELRLAHASLSKIIGNQFTSDDLLDEIFSSFCIGK